LARYAHSAFGGRLCIENKQVDIDISGPSTTVNEEAQGGTGGEFNNAMGS
jgi:hypothetical protein